MPSLPSPPLLYPRDLQYDWVANRVWSIPLPPSRLGWVLFLTCSDLKTNTGNQLQEGYGDMTNDQGRSSFFLEEMSPKVFFSLILTYTSSHSHRYIQCTLTHTHTQIRGSQSHWVTSSCSWPFGQRWGRIYLYEYEV